MASIALRPDEEPPTTDEEFRRRFAEHVKEHPQAVTDGPVHTMFGLTYANYLVWHRTLMQSMPLDWQERFAQLAREYQDAFSFFDRPDTFDVTTVDPDEEVFCSRFTDNQPCGEDCPDDCGDLRQITRPVADPVPHYNRGRTYIPPRIDYEKAEPHDLWEWLGRLLGDLTVTVEPLARAATPGFWRPLPSGDKKWVTADDTTPDQWRANRDADAAYVAAVNPMVMLRLIDAIREQLTGD